jgi:hypothetical protein
MNSDPITGPAAGTAARSFRDTPNRCDKIFYVALKFKEPSERKRFLERACVGDEQLRSAVEEHLATYAEADRFFEKLGSALGHDENKLHREFCDPDAQVRPPHSHTLPCVDK